MANTNAPRGSRFKGWFFDGVNNRLEYYFNGTKVGHLNASGFSITDDSTPRMTDGALTTSGFGSGVVQTADVAAGETIRQGIARVGTVAAVASNGAGALIAGQVFIAPAAMKIVSAWAMNISASDVTKGTATTSASYRRMTLVCNTAAAGTGTHVMASLNATASAASWDTRAFTVVASTIPAGGVVQISHLTVGAETGDGTDMAARAVHIAYELV